MNKIILFFFLLTFPVFAQKDTTSPATMSNNQLFGYIGIGEGTIGYNFNLGIQYIYRSHTFTFRYLYCREGNYYDFAPPLQDDDNGHPVPFINEFAIMYGYTHKVHYMDFPATFLQLNAGIGNIQGSTYEVTRCLPEIFGCEYKETKYSTTGLVYSLQVIQPLNYRFGFGININGNLNNSLKINGATVSIYIGKMY